MTGGAPTWGICRPDLRNDLVARDLVVFFAADRLSDRRPARYVWIGYATVETKVSQLDLFRREKLREFRSYPNLLVRPDPGETGAYIHHESSPREDWHSDWLWKMLDSKRRRKNAFESVHASGRYDPRTTRAAGSLITVAPNYVLFSRSAADTWVNANPPLVAESHGGPEKWMENPLADELRAMLFRGKRTSLRTTNTQDPHPRLPLNATPEASRRELQAIIQRHNLTRR